MNILGIKQLIPGSLLTGLRRLRQQAYAWADARKPFLNHISYCNIQVYYSRGYGIINRIRFGNPDRIYERDLAEKISAALRHSQQPVFLDIGANIGLMSWYVLAQVNNVKVLAFEPGPHQRKLMEITVFANGLEKQVKVFPQALSDQEGTTTFNIHTDYADSAGDGFVDTHRAGSTEQIAVPTVTLDSWWKQQGEPVIPVVKIDTEGAELMVLRGAEHFLAFCHPVIFLEISPLNLKNYPYTALDIFQWLQMHNYSLFTLEGESCSADALNRLLEQTDTFMAMPK